jgi:hypothetical protein
MRSNSSSPSSANAVEARATEAGSSSSSISDSSFLNTPPKAATAAANNDFEVNTESEVESQVNAESEAKGARVFACLPKLAPEIRRIVWKETCSVRRVVDICATQSPIIGASELVYDLLYYAVMDDFEKKLP